MLSSWMAYTAVSTACTFHAYLLRLGVPLGCGLQEASCKCGQRKIEADCPAGSKASHEKESIQTRQTAAQEMAVSAAQWLCQMQMEARLHKKLLSAADGKTAVRSLHHFDRMMHEARV